MSNQETVRVLIAEDNYLVSKMIERLLEEIGYTVVGEAADGLGAVEMTQSLRPDVVLMDIKMLGMDGLEATRHIYETCPTPVVMLTAYDTPEMVEKASAAGALAYVVKPPHGREMERAITIAMARFGDMMTLRRLNAELQAEITERKRAEWALGERVKELTCLYAMSRDMQEDLSIDELCRRTIEYLVLAMQFPEITVPVIELDGRRFTSERYTEGLSHGLHAEIRVGGEASGHLWVYYAEDRPFLIPEEQNLINAIAHHFDLWLDRKRAEKALQHYAERLRVLTQQVVWAQEEERRRLSRELHDEAGQALTALKISLDLIQSDLPVEAGSLHQRLSDAVALTDTTMEQIRLLAQDLRPPALDTMGLSLTLEGLCRDFAERTQLSVDYAGTELPVLPEAVNICLYRFLQEALTNVAKHAHANQVSATLHCDAETVSLSVEDNGQGFDEQARMSVGIGLLGMQERLDILGGRLEIASQPGQGARLVAHVPWREV